MKKFWLNIGVVALGLACFSNMQVAAQETAAGVLPKGFANHGIPAPVSESRGIMAIRDKSGAPLIVAVARDVAAGVPRSSLLVIDARNGETQQYWFPNKETASGEVFSLMRAPDGKIYTTIGHTLLEFDLEKREWTFNGPTDGMAMAFARTSDGAIFFGTYPHSSLYRFDPQTRELEKLVQLDPQEQYPMYVVAGKDGWIYAGMGTARSNIVAYNPQTGERVQLLDEALRKTGSSYVFSTSDGQVYAREFSAEAGRLMKLDGGAATFVEGNPANPQRAVTGGLNWGNMLSVFPGGGGKIVSFSVPEKYAVVELDGQANRISFDYESSGAGISSLIAGPDGKVYGSTNHPMHFFSFDPAGSTLVDHGTIPQVGGGNFPAFAVSGKYIVGDSYAAGAVYEFDTTQPWQVKEDGTTVNPRLLGKFNDVTRPRAAVALPNGDVLFGGYGGYGITGGGLITYDAATRTVSAKPSTELLPNHSVIALRLLDEKTVVGGTTIQAMGGGRVLAKEAELFLLDTTTQSVTFRVVPIEGARSISSLEVGGDGMVYGLTSDSKFFVFDSQTKNVVHRADWTQYGSPFNPGYSLWRGANGLVQVFLSKVLLEVQPDYSVRKVADLPVQATAGGVLLGNRFYYGVGPQLHSLELAPLAP